MKQIEVVAAIIRKDDKIFATQRGYGEWKDWWEFPGGKTEDGETPEEALRREIREELSAEISVDEFLCTVEYDYPALAPGRACSPPEDTKQALASTRPAAAFHLTMHCFLCSLLTETLRLNEHEAARWLSAGELQSVEWLPADWEVVRRLTRKGMIKTRQAEAATTRECPIERHPLAPFLPEQARVLFLGSFPPQRKRWCMEFYYPNFINDHWRIEGEIFFGDKERFVTESKEADSTRQAKKFDREAIIAFCQEKGIAFYDTATAVRRLKDNASDEFLEVVEPTDIRVLLAQLPHCQAIVTTGQKATDTLCHYFGIEKAPKVGESVAIPEILNAQGHEIRLHRLPSSSRAYPLAFDKKVAAYRQMFEAVGLITFHKL